MKSTITLTARPTLRAFALASALLIAACATSPELAVQPDPLSGLHFVPAAVAPLDIPVQTGRGQTTLVLSRNAERLMEGEAAPGAEGQAVVRGAMALLRRHDQRLRLAHSLEEAREQRAVTTLVLDVRDAVPEGGARTVLVSLVALDEGQMPVTRIEAQGSAATGGFQAAGIEALRRFEVRINDVLR